MPTVRQRGGSSGQTIAFGVPLAEGVLRLDGMQPHKHKHLVASESAEIDQIQSICQGPELLLLEQARHQLRDEWLAQMVNPIVSAVPAGRPAQPSKGDLRRMWPLACFSLDVTDEARWPDMIRHAVAHWRPARHPGQYRRHEAKRQKSRMTVGPRTARNRGKLTSIFQLNPCWCSLMCC